MASLSNHLFDMKKEIYRMRNYKFSGAIEKDKDGYFAFCLELQRCYTQGDTYEEAKVNLKDAIRLHAEDRLASGEEIPQL
jgi:predicted RNase H-like HicB family nuclease